MRILLISLVSLVAICSAQQSGPDVAAQRAAMQKLKFLVGKWSGAASVARGPGAPMKITQTEEVQFKIDGLVMLVEGTGRTPAGGIVFRALATISYDDSTGKYHFRAYNDGRYLDTELTVTDKGFSWGYEAGPLKVANTMRLTDRGEWAESTETTFGSSPPRKSVEMLLRRLP